MDERIATDRQIELARQYRLRGGNMWTYVHDVTVVAKAAGVGTAVVRRAVSVAFSDSAGLLAAVERGDALSAEQQERFTRLWAAGFPAMARGTIQ